MIFSSVQSLSRVRLFVTPWTAAHQTSLSITNSRSLLKLMSMESVMPSSYLILCRPLLLPLSSLPSIRVFSNELVFASGGQSTGVSAQRPNVYLDLCSLNLTITYLAYKSNAESPTTVLFCLQMSSPYSKTTSAAI